MVDYELIKAELKQRQTELASKRIALNKRNLRTGIQSLPQRKQISRFNNQIKTQINDYERQIRAINTYLEAENQISIPIPNINFIPDPRLTRLRNRFKKGGRWF